MGVESFEAWKAGALDRLKAHFEQEAEAADSLRAFFGVSARKGLALFDLLARRYDVVAANPPYMGSKNMGAVTKSFVERSYPAGKRDLYAAFILRCRELAAHGGRVAMVTQQSWMFLRSFADLRAVEPEKIKKLHNQSSAGLLRDSIVEIIAHLGEHAFSDSSAAGAFATVFVVCNAAPARDHRLSAYRLLGPKSPEQKEALLREALRLGVRHPIVSHPIQSRFLDIPKAPLSYWLSDVFLDLLHRVAPVSGSSYVRQGICTTDNPRFMRFAWEAQTNGAFDRWFP